MDQTSTLVSRIEAACPALLIRTVRSASTGQFNHVLVVNERLVFRFPRYARQARNLPTQVAILRGIRAYVNLSVPEPIPESSGLPTVGDAFIGYPMIPGVPLSRDALESLDDDTLGAVVGQLASFVRRLHSVPRSAIAADLSNLDGRDQWADLYARIRARLFSSMRADARAAVTEHFESFLENLGSFDFEPVPRHGDLGAENILFDPTSGRLSGVVDFDFAGLGDPATDLAVVLSPGGFGERFVQKLRSLLPMTTSMLTRGSFYRGTWALQEALHGIEEGDDDAFDRGIAGYR